MAILNKSTKFTTTQTQHQISAMGYILLRLLEEDEGTWKVMTATTSIGEDRIVQAFPNRQALMDAAVQVFASPGRQPDYRSDRLGNPYVQFRDLTLNQISLGADSLAGKLGLGPAVKSWMEEVRDLRDAIAVDDGPAYLCDGMGLDEDGNIVSM